MPQVVQLGSIEKHPNADTLGVTKVLGDYPVITKLDEFHEGDTAIYVPVDTLVPTDNELFKWLDSGKGRTHERVKAKKLRGVFSMGLLVPNVLGLGVGEDPTFLLGLEKYVPPSEREFDTSVGDFKHSRNARKSETVKYDRQTLMVAAGLSILFTILFGYYSVFATAVFFFSAWYMIMRNREINKKPNIPVYDIEGYRHYPDTFQPGEEVWITEKIHGCCARYVHTGKRFFSGSRTIFRLNDDGNVWSRVAKKYNLEEKLKDYPNIALYGEIYGNVQDLTYGVEEEFVAFDAMDAKTRRWFDVSEFMQFCQKLDIPIVPTLHLGSWDKSLTTLAEGKTTMPGANHVREGIVIKPLTEQHVHNLGRKFLKLAGEGYLTRKEVS